MEGFDKGRRDEKTCGGTGRIKNELERVEVEAKEKDMKDGTRRRTQRRLEER